MHSSVPLVPEGRILVTGAAGFIGSATIWALNRAGHDDVIACDRLDRSEKWRNLVPLRFRDYVEADDLLARLSARGDAFDGVSTIVHLGACSATTETDALYLVRNNYEFTKALAAAALERGIRFVYASSAATYGALETGLDELRPLETLRPLNMYAYSKQLFDRYAAQHGFLERIVGIKYFNVFGPNEAHKGDMRSVVSKAFDQIVAGGAVQLFRSHKPEYRDGEQRRDFVYVKDAVAMTLGLAAHPGAGGLYNVGSGRASTWLELIRPVFAALGRTERIEFVDMPEHLRAKYQYSTCASIERVRALGYARELTPLAGAVHDYVAGYLADDRRLDPLVDERTPPFDRLRVTT
jgi:ADP-L-glycero-D-manno-heptose 6-epimerase